MNCLSSCLLQFVFLSSGFSTCWQIYYYFVLLTTPIIFASFGLSYLWMNEKLIFYYPVAEFFCSYSLIVYVNMLIDAAGGENTVKECLEVQLSAIDSNFSVFYLNFKSYFRIAIQRS